MQLSRSFFAVSAVMCSLATSIANADFRSTSTLSAIARECLHKVLDCVVQSPNADLGTLQWGKAEDPASDCKFACSSETLSITVPGTYHSLSTANKNFLAPRVLQEVTGNFSIVTKVKCFEPLASGGSTNSTAATDNYVGSGILIWQDEKNFFRLMQAARGDRQQKVIQLRVGDKLIFEYVYNFDAEHIYLRVSRVGRVFGVSVSEDGKRWLAPSITAPAFHDATSGFNASVRAGVVVVNAVNQEIHGEFSELKITHEPELTVHDSFRVNLEFPRTPLTELRDPRVQQDLQLQPNLLAALKEFDVQLLTLPVADRTNENSDTAQDLRLKTWASIRPLLSAPQTQRLAALEFQRFGPRSLLLEIVQEQLKLDKHALTSIAKAREILEESVEVRKSSIPSTPESESKYRALRLRANELLTEAASGATQDRLVELKADLFLFKLPGMISPKELSGSHPLGPLADLLRQPAVQQELRLSREVTEEIERFLEKKSRLVAGAIEKLELDLSDNPSPRVLNAWGEAYRHVAVIRRELELECGKCLTAEQNSRLQQLLYQALGPQTILVSDLARDALELTSQQREDLQRMEEGLAKSQDFSSLICKSLWRDTDVSQLLTEQQREKMQRFKGITFHFVAVNR